MTLQAPPTNPTKVLFCCTGVGIFNRGIESFFREAFDGLTASPDLDTWLIKGRGKPGERESFLRGACREHDGRHGGSVASSGATHTLQSNSVAFHLSFTRFGVFVPTSSFTVTRISDFSFFAGESRSACAFGYYSPTAGLADHHLTEPILFTRWHLTIWIRRCRSANQLRNTLWCLMESVSAPRPFSMSEAVAWTANGSVFPWIARRF